ncbi:MAG: hypothetical protein LBP28_05595 [Coriobacteriales bacterium]|jgi:hypothetical protein|nr:hypothetical protein [Coriobacteriales bacterium]
MTIMPNNSGNITTGKPNVTGSIFHAPHGTTLPADATTALPAAFENLGFIGEDGVKNPMESSTSDIKEGGGKTVLTTLDESSDKFSVVLIEALRAEVLKRVFGDQNVTVNDTTGNIAIAVDTSYERPEGVWVFEILLTKNRIKRIVVPQGKIVSVSEVTYVRNEPVGYEIEIATSPDAANKTHYEYIAMSAEPEGQENVG